MISSQDVMLLERRNVWSGADYVDTNTTSIKYQECELITNIAVGIMRDKEPRSKTT